MQNSLRKLKTFVLGPRTGSSISMNVPESDHNPKPQPVRSSIEIDEPDALLEQPDGDGWVKTPWGRYRKIKCGQGSSMDYDDGQEPGQRRRIREVNNPFAGSRWNWRND